MKTKIYFSVLLFCLTLLTFQSNAQCGARYKDLVFSAVTKTTVDYSTAHGALAMDIYEPTGDAELMRPVLIMAHGGSFTSGNKSNDNVVTLFCNNYAKRGYVTVSIDYRLGSVFQMLDSAYAINTVMKAISDGKSAIRFLRKNATTYKINPNFIIGGGNSAGAVLFMHVIYIDSTNEAPPYLRSVINANGGFEGNSGNDGFSSELQGLMNLAGGLNVPEFVGPNSKPSFNAQGDQDNTVPYGCGLAQGGLTPVRLCGLQVIEPLYSQFSVVRSNIIYPGDGHCPWASNATKLNEIDTASASFFYQMYCSTIASVNELRESAEISVFPNPAGSEVNISSGERISRVSLYDNIGHLVAQVSVQNNSAKINTDQFSKGIYSVNVEFENRNVAAAIKKLVIE